jgi:hypothetical protein
VEQSKQWGVLPIKSPLSNGLLTNTTNTLKGTRADDPALLSLSQSIAQQ